MRLRNKNTGEVIDLDIANIKAQFGAISVIPEPVKLGGDEYVYHSLAELCEDWKDYEPREPLIKDGKIRKAVRAWAEANEISQAQFDRYTSGFSASDAGNNFLSMISFDGFVFNCVDGKYYTIDELCGDEE